MMLQTLLSSYKISADVLKKIFPEHNGLIDEIVFIEGHQNQMGAEQLNKYEEIIVDFISSLSTIENQNRISQYVIEHPGEQDNSEHSPLPAIDMNTEEIVPDPAMADEMLIPEMANASDWSEDEGLIPSEQPDIIIGETVEHIEPTMEIVIPEEESAPDIHAPIPDKQSGWRMNEQDNLLYENFKINTLPKLLVLQRGDNRAEYYSSGMPTGIIIYFNQETVNRLIQEYFLKERGVPAEQGNLINDLYRGRFPYGLHPFNYVFKEEASIFPYAIIDGSIRDCPFINVNGFEYLYNGDSLLERAGTNFSGKDNLRNVEFETLVNAIVKQSAAESCIPSGYNLKISQSEKRFDVEGEGELGQVIFNCNGSSNSCDNLVLGYLFNKYGNELKFYHLPSAGDMHLIAVEKQGEAIAYLFTEKINDEKIIPASDAERLLNKIKEDFFAETQYISFEEFLKRDAGLIPIETASPVSSGQSVQDAIEQMQTLISLTKNKKKIKEYQRAVDQMKVLLEYSSPAATEQIQDPVPTTKKITAQKEYSGKRPSPSQHASKTEVGTKMEGNDGNTWEVKATANGTHRWAKISRFEAGGEIGNGAHENKVTYNEKRNPLQLIKNEIVTDGDSDFTIAGYDKNKGGYWAYDMSDPRKIIWTGPWKNFYKKYKKK